MSLSLFCFFVFCFLRIQRARPETCCLRCWSLILLNGYQWMRPYSTPTSTCGMIQLRWRRWVGLLAELCIDHSPKLNSLLLSLIGQHCLLIHSLCLHCLIRNNDDDSPHFMRQRSVSSWYYKMFPHSEKAGPVHLQMCFKCLVHISFSFFSHLWFYLLYIISEFKYTFLALVTLHWILSESLLLQQQTTT